MAVEVDQRVHIAAPPERVWRALIERRRPAALALPERGRRRARRRLVALHVSALAVGARPAPPRAQLRRADRRARAGPRARRAVRAALLGRPALRAAAPTATAPTLRVTQRGFEGNEDWLADFRGGWGSFNDRLALLCEIGEVATPRRLEATLAAERDARAGRAGRRAGRSWRRTLPARPYWYADGGRITLVAPGRRRRPPATSRAATKPCDALCLALPPTADLEAARASLERSLPRRGWTAAGPLRAAVDPAHPSRLRARPPLPPGRSIRRSRAVRARIRARLLRARSRRGRLPTSPRAARSRWPAGRIRARSTRRSRACPSRRVARFWRLRLGSDGVLTADWEGNGWTAGRNRGTSTWTFAGDGRIERLDPALRPGRAAHGRRMTEAWVAALRAALGDRVHTQAGRARRRRARRLARDRTPRGADLSRDDRARRDRRAHRAPARRADRPARRRAPR